MSADPGLAQRATHEESRDQLRWLQPAGINPHEAIFRRDGRRGYTIDCVGSVLHKETG